MSTEGEIRQAQALMNGFTKKYLRGVKPLAEDGELGPDTNTRVPSVKFYVGFGAKLEANSSDITDKFVAALKDPKGKRWGKRVLAAGAARRTRQRAQVSVATVTGAAGAGLFGGSRGVTDEVIKIVGGRAPITSRKRKEDFGNPGSDHLLSQRNADAVDFGTANNHALKNEISHKLGGPATLEDFGKFTIARRGKTFRVQMIAQTHGTGPHLHVGVRRT